MKGKKKEKRKVKSQRYEQLATRMQTNDMSNKLFEYCDMSFIPYHYYTINEHDKFLSWENNRTYQTGEIFKLDKNIKMYYK